MDLINYAKQLNPNNIVYWFSRGYAARPDNWASLVAGVTSTTASVINRANQLNPNNVAYWLSRGYAARPDNWATLAAGVTGAGVVGAGAAGAAVGTFTFWGIISGFFSILNVVSLCQLAYRCLGYFFSF